MPRTPTDVERKDPGKQPVGGVKQHGGQHQQQGYVQREDLVFLEVGASVIRAVNRGHEMRIVEGQSQAVKCHDPSVGVRLGQPQGRSEQRSGPGAAADDQVEPRPVNPRPVGTGGGDRFSLRTQNGIPRDGGAGTTKLRAWPRPAVYIAGRLFPRHARECMLKA